MHLVPDLMPLLVLMPLASLFVLPYPANAGLVNSMAQLRAAFAAGPDPRDRRGGGAVRSLTHSSGNVRNEMEPCVFASSGRGRFFMNAALER